MVQWSQQEQSEQLDRLRDRPTSWATRAQAEEIVRELQSIRVLLEQAGRKKERRFSLPRLHLPTPDGPTVYFLTLLLAGLGALWYTLGNLWNALSLLLP